MKTPTYRKKTVRSSSGKSIAYAVTKINGKEKILGRWNTKESKKKFHRLMTEYQTGSVDPAVQQTTVLEISVDYTRFAKDYYRKNGKQTTEFYSVQSAMRLLVKLYGDLPATEIGPRRLRELRSTWIDRELARSTINDYTNHVIRCFRKAAESEKIPGSVYHDLSAVGRLPVGRTKAKEPRRIRPVSQDIFDAVLEHVQPIVADMMRLQALCAMRPGEVCNLKPIDVDRSGDTWIYRPESHKNQHHGKARIVAIGPQGQAILRPYLLRDENAFCYCPGEVVEQKRRRDSLNRTTPLSCGNRPGSNRKIGRKKRQAGQKYSTTAYRRAITRGCDSAFPTSEEMTDEQVKEHRQRYRFAPNRIRKLAATKIRKQCSLESAQVILGHASKTTTERYYADMNISEAVEVMRKLG